MGYSGHLVAWVLGLLAVFCITFELIRPDVLLVGNVTVDVLANKGTRPGGAVTYAAAVAQGLHRRSCIVTTAADGTDLSSLGGRQQPGQRWHHFVHVVPSKDTLTFEHTYTWFGNQRQLRVTKTPSSTLQASDVPLHCRFARLVVIGPLIYNDVNVPSFTKPKSRLMRLIRRFQILGLMAQGQQRELWSKGRVEHIEHPSPALMDSITPDVHLFLSDVETDAWRSTELKDVVSKVKSLVVTRGEKGVSVHQHNQKPLHIPAVKIIAVDTNGAGDTFATTFLIRLSQGSSIEDAGMSATWAASRVCMKQQACKPQCCIDAVREQDDRDSQPHPRTTKPPMFTLEAIEVSTDAPQLPP